VTFPTSMDLHFNGDQISVIHYPTGHTDGDSIVWFKKANVVHLGDHFFVGSFPFVDLGSGGSVSGYIGNLEKMLAQLPKDIKVIPGHGPLSNIKELRVFKNMIKDTSRYIAGKMSAKMSLADIQKNGLPSKWESFGKGFIKEDTWIGIVYRSLEADAAKKKRS
jgi:cyclase